MLNNQIQGPVYIYLETSISTINCNEFNLKQMTGDGEIGQHIIPTNKKVRQESKQGVFFLLRK